MNGFDRIIRRCLHAFAADHGSAAVSFILTFPIFLTIVAVIVQLALMVNARIMVASAADAAARSAMTSLPDGHPENVRNAALLALAPLGPEATSGSSADASGTVDALRSLGVDVPDSLAARYAYAMEATTVSWTPEIEFAQSKASEVEVTVNYQFRLTVPVAMRMVPAAQNTVGGLSGMFWEVSGKSRMETSHGRKAQTNGDGWPN